MMDPSELRIVRAAINSALMVSTIEDLKIAYRDLRPQAKDSKLTVSLRGALDIVDFHLIEGEANDRQSEDDSSGDAELGDTGTADSSQRDDGSREDSEAQEAGSSDGRPQGDV